MASLRDGMVVLDVLSHSAQQVMVAMCVHGDMETYDLGGDRK